jgi:hypothetical protein
VAQRFKRQLRSLSDITKAFTDPLLSKQGFLSGSLLKDWTVIVGANYAKTVLPEKVIFPKDKNTDGTLYVTVESSGVACLFEHAKGDIIHRINSYYGYAAISSIRIKTSHHYKLLPVKKQRDLSFEEREVVEGHLAHVEDDALKAILVRLGMAITLDNKQDNQEK